MKPRGNRPAKQNDAGTLGSAIRAAREKAGLTQEELAAAAGLPRYWLGRWERGRALPTTDQRIKLTRVLRCEILTELFSTDFIPSSPAEYCTTASAGVSQPLKEFLEFNFSKKIQ